MKKNYRYLKLLPFAISIVCLVIYLFYIIHIKLHPSIIVTDAMVTTLKVLLIIALISLFIGLLLILIRKIYALRDTNKITIKKTTVTKTIPKVNEETEIKDNDSIIINEEIVKEDISNNIKKEEVISEIKKEEKIYIQNEKDEVKELFARCPECNKLISEKAAICPHCGILFDKEVIRVLKKYDKKKIKEERSYGIVSTLINIFVIILFIILIILVSNILVDKYNKNYKKLNPFNTEEKQ